MGNPVTIAEQAPANFYHFILDIEAAGDDGRVPVPNAKHVDYAMIALGAGYPSAFNFDELDAFSAGVAGDSGKKPGPGVRSAKVWPEVENTPIGQRVCGGGSELG